jgi:hypothetical protein
MVDDGRHVIQAAGAKILRQWRYADFEGTRPSSPREKTVSPMASRVALMARCLKPASIDA